MVSQDFYLAPNGVTCECPNADFGDSGTLTINGEQKTFTKRTEDGLRTLIEANVNNPEIALTCTTGITDMSSFFEDKTEFNQNISSWDLSNVIDMSRMFDSARSFNQPLNNWDVSNVINMQAMFILADSFNKPLNNWNVSNVTNMRSLFRIAEAFNQPLNDWDVSSVDSMALMFRRAESFNQPLGNWDVSNVTDMSLMFSGAASFDQTLASWSFNSEVLLEEFLSYSGFSQENYDLLLQSFESQSLFNINLGAELIGYCDEQTREGLINEKGWTIEGDIFALCDETLNPSTSPFVTTWTVYNGDLNIILNIPGFYDYNFSVNWGDGEGNTGVTQTISHNYAAPGTYTVEIIGVYPYFSSLCEGARPFCDNARKLSTVESWGDQEWQLMHSSFKFARNFTMSATDIPDLSQVTSMSYMFSFANAFNQPINNWDVSGVTDMNHMFYNASSFSQPLSNWNVSSVTDMSFMFSNADAFNQPLNNWDVSSVTDMSLMFSNAHAFNQFLDNWDVSNVNTMNQMFSFTPLFNQPLNNWDVSKVENMSVMFFHAPLFNQPLNNWDVSSVTNMSSMFVRAESFNQPLNNWDVSNVTSIRSMFKEASSYNQNLSNWDVSSVTDMRFMFEDAVSFNQDISTWCVEQIPTEPNNFSLNSPLQDSFKPIWGTCESLSTTIAHLNELTLFPNPVSEKLFVDFQSSYNFQSIKIFDMLGREVKALNPDRIQEGIEVSGMNTGSYLIQFMTQDKQQLTKRFIIK